MKICFEGPSAVGKSTLSQTFAGEYTIVPEVTKLFDLSENTDDFWYYHKQIERYNFDTGPMILDGDPFQPLWYNWTYNYPKGWLSLEEMCHFYEQQIKTGAFKFPDLYFFFLIDENELRQRKERDSTRRRRNFQKHLKLLKTQPAYFGCMKKQFPSMIEMVEYKDVESTREKIVDRLSNFQGTLAYDSLEVLHVLKQWLQLHPSDEF